jgi:hypothetical protein
LGLKIGETYFQYRQIIQFQNTVKLGNKEFFGNRKIVHLCQFVHYLLDKLANWSREMVRYCQVVPYSTIPESQV